LEWQCKSRAANMVFCQHYFTVPACTTSHSSGEGAEPTAIASYQPFSKRPTYANRPPPSSNKRWKANVCGCHSTFTTTWCGTYIFSWWCANQGKWYSSCFSFAANSNESTALPLTVTRTVHASSVRDTPELLLHGFQCGITSVTLAYGRTCCCINQQHEG